ncbi:hypothetical protein WICPIJ_005515 [Wickerhamomyces pijperi]|uniref:Uncharacterized protein n=1 Tax=Wickerhamomyces pijperi TaxID=599730 RepID=A0A9P8Q646_WICPI|nr:hypothetical protein WICPIJ_005515 [Wickerhamomyces pijperi]
MFLPKVEDPTNHFTLGEQLAIMFDDTNKLLYEGTEVINSITNNSQHFKLNLINFSDPSRIVAKVNANITKKTKLTNFYNESQFFVQNLQEVLLQGNDPKDSRSNSTRLN